MAVPGKPVHLTGGAGGPFVAARDGRVFAATGADGLGKLGSTAPGPRGIAASRGSVWAASPHAIVRMDPGGSRPAVRLHSRAGLMGLAAAGRVVWALAADGALLRLDPRRALRSGAIPSALPNSRPAGIAASPGAVFVADRQGRLLRLDRLGRHLRWIGVGKDPVGVAAGDGFAWVALGDGTVLQVRPRVGGWQTRQIRIGGRPAAIAFGGGQAWLAEMDGRVFAIDPAGGGRTLSGTADPGVTDLAYSGGAVWVARGAGRPGELVEIGP